MSFSEFFYFMNKKIKNLIKIVNLRIFSKVLILELNLIEFIFSFFVVVGVNC